MCSKEVFCLFLIQILHKVGTMIMILHMTDDRSHFSNIVKRDSEGKSLLHICSWKCHTSFL